MPCKPQKARQLLKQGKAKIIKYSPFTIQLTEATGEAVQTVNIGIDTGSKYIGIAITSEDKVLAKGEIELRQDVSENVVARAILRKSRRGRKTRYRQARFLNRKRKGGWIPPSVQSKLDATFMWIDKFCALVPNPQLSIEIGKFDIAKMINPNVQGEDYQNGDSKGFFDVRYFVFARDNYTCQVCKKKNKVLRTHHLVYNSLGGTNRADNLISVCTDCHTSEAHKTCGILYKWMKNKKKVKQYKEPTFMNIVRKRTFLRYPNARVTYGSETTPKRKEIGLEKTHYNDAIVISGILAIKENPIAYFYYKQFRKKKRSLHESIPRRWKTQKNVNSIRSAKNTKERFGFYLGDKVKYKDEIGWIYGFAGGEKYGKECIVRDINEELIRSKGRKASLTVAMSNLIVLGHSNGWLVDMCI